MSSRAGYALLIASVGSFTMFPGLGTYCASKAAVEHLPNALRLELAHRGVRVGSAHPTWLDTDLVRDSDELRSVKNAAGACAARSDERSRRRSVRRHSRMRSLRTAK